ncbi:MAG: hypothetical protein JNJ90_00820 [Saprospiraceae bacterium]|nr:hypothetical protein [Saprospiraceae bacterium]
MAKRFNITGTCFPERHFMADVSRKFKVAIALIRKGKYFAINRPRQYGKTTLLEALSRELSKSDEWLVLRSASRASAARLLKMPLPSAALSSVCWKHK